MRDVFFRFLRFVARHLRGFYSAVLASVLLAFLVGAAAATAFALFGHVVAAGATQAFDERVLRWVAGHRTPWLDNAMLEVTTLGSTLVVSVLVGVACVFLWLTRHHLSVYLLALALFGSIVLNALLKDYYERARPEVVPAVVPTTSPSFPSGHALSAFMIYGTVAYLVARLEPTRALRRATWAIAGLIILLVGASRVYLGVHYPSDVLAGFVAALAWTAFVASGVTALSWFAARRPEVAREEEGLLGRPPRGPGAAA